MSEFKGAINLSTFESWSALNAKSKADKDGFVECPHCHGTNEVEVVIELPSGRYMEVDDFCQDCDEGQIHVDDLKDSDLTMVASKTDYRMDCAESVLLLSSATKSDYFLNLCKAKEMHK